MPALEMIFIRLSPYALDAKTPLMAHKNTLVDATDLP